MEPTPETTQALRELARKGEVAVGVELQAMTDRARAIVPELIGLSLGVLDEGITLTLIASADDLAALDAVQYLDGGPCVAAADQAEPINAQIDDLLDEGRWQFYAHASAATGVASSLSMPLLSHERVVGGVNLYASTPDAFRGHYDALAWALSSDATLAVANADLSFSTRTQAMQAPARLQESNDVSIALGLISASQDVTLSVATERLHNAAARAGISVVQAARAIRFVRES